MRPALLALAVAALGLAACTSGHGGSGPSTAPTTTGTATITSAPPSAPLPAGPTTEASASCPLVGEQFVHLTLGVRLGRASVLRAGGQVVGCRFYAQQQPGDGCDATCLAGEHLPGPNQPVAEITTQRYPSDTAAHNAFVLRAGSAPGITQVPFGGVTGLCFQDAFDPQDHGQDAACTVNKGPVMVLVRTVDTTGTSSTATLTAQVLTAVAA